jgi:hypothetical protein
MIDVANPIEVVPASGAENADVIRVRSADIDLISQKAKVRVELGDESSGSFVPKTGRIFTLSLSDSLTANIANKLETALKSRIANKLGVSDGDLTPR